MPAIYSYRKVFDAYTTYALAEPDGVRCTELATIDGTTYVSVPDGAQLPAQPAQITVVPVQLDDALKTALRAASPPLQLIDRQVVEQIRSRYTENDELYLARIGVGKALGTYEPSTDELAELRDYQAWVEAAREWGRAQRAALGL